MIQIQDLTVGYGTRRVLEEVTLDFRQGEVLALVGPNGCGKSTLTRTVLGLLPKLGGEILVDGRPARELSPKELAQKAAYLAQTRSAPNITAGRMVFHGRFPHLSYPRSYRPQDKEMVRRSMERTGTLELEGQLMPKLSGGQQQKIYLAMALAQDTPTLFWDEPTTYLDARHQLDVMDLACSLAGEGRAVVMVLHDLCMALRGAHRVAVFHQGRLRQVGTPEEIYASGVVEETFGVRLGRVQTPSGWRYFYE